MSKELFGFNEEGNEVFLYTLENDKIRAAFSDYGATMVSLIEKSTGINVLLGFDSIEGYIGHDAHIGGFIGRTANRTKGASFELNGIRYEIQKNDGENNLHGGSEGFDRVMYEAQESENSVTFTRLSLDGEMGYPGDLSVRVTYTLNGDTVEMKAEGKAMGEDTVFAMTNHNYYNLDESDSILTHKVVIPAERYADDAEDGVAELPMKNVENTPFDFRQEKELGKDISCEDAQIKANRGYDHHFAVDGSGMRTFAVCTGEKLKLTIGSNLPGMHMYTANFLNVTGRGSKVYAPHCAVCFEPEYFPNGINQKGVEQPIVRAYETSVQIITMKVEPL